MPKLELDDPMVYQNFIRKPPKLFHELEQRLLSSRGREPGWEPMSPGLKLAVTLRHLATGDSYTTLQYAFRVASSTINKFVAVCDTMIRAYRDQVMRCPTIPEDWLQVEHSACTGCPGWKAYSYHISKRERQPIPQLQGLHSIVLLALVDGDYKFLWVEVGAAGSSSDTQIFKHSDLGHKTEDSRTFSSSGTFFTSSSGQ